MEQRFRALRTIGSIFRVLGYIILVLTILVALAFCGISTIGAAAIESSVSQSLGVNANGGGFLGGLFGGLLGGFFILLYGGFMALAIVAAGEMIYLAIGVEENTRRTSFLIENQIARMVPPSSSAMTPSRPKPMAPTEQEPIPPAI